MTLNDSQGWTFNGAPYFGNGSLANETQIRSVLADLRYIGISTDIVSGGDANPDQGSIAARNLPLVSTTAGFFMPSTA
jgi:hypothetical protein